MTKNKMIIGAAALTAIIAVAGIAASSYASERGAFQRNFKGSISDEDREDRREVMQSKRISMQEVVNNNDYEGWKALMEEKIAEDRASAGEMAERINEDNFYKLVKVHQLMQDGNYEEARELRQDLGFGGGMGNMGCEVGGFHRNLEN